jgi:hypothetical protein
MSDLHERLQELADAAARHGTTPGPAHAVRRGRRRRRRITAGVAGLLAAALVGGGVAGGRLADRPAAPAAGPVTTTSAPTQPQVSTSPPRRGSPEDRAFRTLAAGLRGCGTGAADRVELLGSARLPEHGRVWMAVAKPPSPGDTGICWNNGLFGPGGGASYGGAREPAPVRRLTASGSIEGDLGTIEGQVLKRAVRVRVAFRDGRRPLDLPVIDAGARYPVNFYVGFFEQRHIGLGFPRWAPTDLTAFDAAGRPVAGCTVEPRATGRPRCPGN